MAIEMVRKPSETPNILNFDDFIGLRYAYGNQDGYVKGRGNECSYSIDQKTYYAYFKINSGRLVIQGIECDINADGVEYYIGNLPEAFYTIYLQVKPALNKAELYITYDTEDYPIIDKGDDLTENSTGVARLEIYHLKAINGVVSDVEKVVNPIEFINEDTIKNTMVNNSIHAINATNANNANNSTQINNLDIKRNANGLLILNEDSENIIIPQKKVIWQGNKEINSKTQIKIIPLSEMPDVSQYSKLECILKKDVSNEIFVIHLYLGGTVVAGQHLEVIRHPDSSSSVGPLNCVNLLYTGSLQGESFSFSKDKEKV